MSAGPSYASGPSTVPLLGETIGAKLDRAVAANGSRLTSWTTSLIPARRGVHAPGGYASTGVKPNEQVNQVRLELGTNKVLTKAAASQSVVNAMAKPSILCYTTDKGRRGPTMATWVALYTSTHTIGGYDYTSSTSHRLAVGVSYSYGALNSFKIEGSSTKTAELGTNSLVNVADAAIKAYWWYEGYGNTCVPAQYYMRPLIVHSMPYYSYAPHIRQPFCGPYYYGQVYTRTSGSNHDYSVGVNVGGANGDSQAGWTTSTVMKYTIGMSSGGGKLCWNGENGGSANGRMQVAPDWSGEG